MIFKKNNVNRKVLVTSLALVMVFGGAALPEVSSPFSLINEVSASDAEIINSTTSEFTIVVKSDNTVKITGLKNKANFNSEHNGSSYTVPSQIDVIVDTFNYNGQTIPIHQGLTVSEIGFQAFEGCSFSELSISTSIKVVGDGAFMNCTNLETVTFEDAYYGPEKIGYKAFFNCPKLSSYWVPGHNKEIGGLAFGYITDNTKVQNFRLGSYNNSDGSESAKKYADQNGFECDIYEPWETIDHNIYKY